MSEYTPGHADLEKIGKRIRMIRLQKGLTQSALAGEDVTRNMISRIENGAALPSLPTLCAVANKLDIPIGALFSDIRDYSDWKLSRELHRLLSNKKYDRIIEHCRQININESDDDVLSILGEAYTERAYELYGEGHLSAALQYLEAAEQALDKCENVSEIKSSTAVLSARIFILRTLASGCSALYQGEEHEHQSADDDMLRALIFDENELPIYLFCLAKLNKIPHGAYSRPHELAESLRGELEPVIQNMRASNLRTHIEAKLDMISAEYLDAKAKLLPLLKEKLPPALLYDILADLEFCCKCCGDFENAYNYSGKRLELAKKIN